jgi:hypothetical protein
VNQELYIDNFRELWDAVRRELPEKWRNNILFFLHNNAPAHRSVLVKDFIAKEQRDNTEATATRILS